MPDSPLASLLSHAASRRRFLGLSATAAGAALLAGCASAAGAATPAASGSAPRQTLAYLDAEVPTTAQVQESGTWQTRALQQNLTDRLLFRNAETNELEPWIAESWERSADGLTYAFVIREGVTYSDGTPVDVRSVKRNLEWQSTGDPDKGVSANGQFPAALTVEADPASRTVRVRLEEPYAPFLAVLTSWSAGLVADATIDAPYEDQARYVNLIGSGPFVVTSEVYAQQVVLTRRSGYAWAPPSAPNQGEAHLETLSWIPVEEDPVRLGALSSGEGDVIRYVEPSETPGLLARGFHVEAHTGVGLSNQWFLRTGVAPLDDVRVRRALLRAIDRDEILRAIYTDDWHAATSVLSPATEGYRDQSAKIAPDPAAAAALLDEAGWTGRDADGYRVKDGARLHLKTYIDVYDNTAKSLFQFIQAQFARLGIELELDELDYSSYSAGAFSDPAVGLLRVGWPHPDPGVGLAEYYSADKQDLLGLGGSDTELQGLIDASLRATDDAERADVLGRIQDRLIDEAYVVPILDDSQVLVTRPEVTGLVLTDGALPSFHDVRVTA